MLANSSAGIIDNMKRILVHACCTDCALKLLSAIEKESEEAVELALFYYNPNIHPRSEYLARLKAMQEMLGDKYELIVPNWSPKEYFARIGRLSPKERLDKKSRCPECWRLRLGVSMEYAREQGYEAMSSTLLSSQYQDQERVKEIAEELAREHGLEFISPTSIECEMKTSGFYKQNYCGCSYSLIERMQEKYELKV